jgi:uncharacterized protein YajQ (UPF0234 family)
MASECSFDVVSKVDLEEVRNAVGMASKEIGQRYDFKGSSAEIAFKGDEVLALAAENDFKLKAVVEILQAKLAKRGVPVRNLDYGKVEPAAKGTVRQEIKVQQGIPTEKAKALVKAIKDAKLKVQAAIQGDQLRVSGKSRDDLQACIALLKQQDQGLDLQFTNYRG